MLPRNLSVNRVVVRIGVQLQVFIPIHRRRELNGNLDLPSTNLFRRVRRKFQVEEAGVGAHQPLIFAHFRLFRLCACLRRGFYLQFRIGSIILVLIRREPFLSPAEFNKFDSVFFSHFIKNGPQEFHPRRIFVQPLSVNGVRLQKL